MRVIGDLGMIVIWSENTTVNAGETVTVGVSVIMSGSLSVVVSAGVKTCVVEITSAVVAVGIGAIIDMSVSGDSW